MQAIHMPVYVYFSAQGMTAQIYSIWNFGACVPSYTMSHLRWKQSLYSVVGTSGAIFTVLRLNFSIIIQFMHKSHKSSVGVSFSMNFMWTSYFLQVLHVLCISLFSLI
jgi:hypothetical protein